MTDGQSQRGSRDIPKGLPKDWKKLAEAMKAAGWTFEERTKGIRGYAPDGVTTATLHKTPSEWRGLRNERAKFRRWCRDRGIDPGI
jgi:hypothetical protein